MQPVLQEGILCLIYLSQQHIVRTTQVALCTDVYRDQGVQSCCCKRCCSNDVASQGMQPNLGYPVPVLVNEDLGSTCVPASTNVIMETIGPVISNIGRVQSTNLRARTLLCNCRALN